MKILKNSSLFFLFAVLLTLPAAARAQADRSYYYEKISQVFTVNQDTTVNVAETQTYNFSGEYHKGWRSLPLKKVSAIIDVSVIDEASGQPLELAPSPLEKTNPASWGKYYYRQAGGSLEIEWYFDALNSSRSWTLNYKLIGALSFLKDKDELYWNLFTDYDVPVKRAEAKVIIPDPLGDYGLPFPSAIYLKDADNPRHAMIDNRTFMFSADNIRPRGIVTIAAGWPRGIVDRSAYWKQFLATYYALIISGFLILATIIFIIAYWYFTEKRNKGRGTIIAEYQPPRNLPPAMAELIVKERLTPKAWAATVIDLAVRGYVKITETEKSFSLRTLLAILPGALMLIYVLAFFKGWRSGGLTTFHSMSVFFVALIGIIFASLVRRGKKIVAKDYVIEPIKPWRDDKNLHDYEINFLNALFAGDGSFSTKKMKTDHSAAKELYLEMAKINKKMWEETELDTQAYEKPVSKEIYKILGWGILLGLLPFIPAINGALGGNYKFITILVTFIFCAAAVWIYIKFEARLTKEGAILREEWLGFKLYLETAERYRLQNLTPEIFEKYLPYAIIFGVEKKWGRAFEQISLPAPSWYAGTPAGTIRSGAVNGSTAGFSASVFSASFASSFTSAFAAAGGGGASGGGGGAGGGGGGGGGGAS